MRVFALGFPAAADRVLIRLFDLDFVADMTRVRMVGFLVRAEPLRLIAGLSEESEATGLSGAGHPAVVFPRFPMIGVGTNQPEPPLAGEKPVVPWPLVERPPLNVREICLRAAGRFAKPHDRHDAEPRLGTCRVNRRCPPTGIDQVQIDSHTLAGGVHILCFLGSLQACEDSPLPAPRRAA